MSDMRDKVPETLHLAIPTMEIVTTSRRSETRGSVVEHYVLQDGIPPRVEGSEQTLSSMAGGWTILVTVDDEGCVPAERTDPVGEPMLATIAMDGVGMAIATNQRFIGSVFDVPALGLHPDESRELLWEVRYEHITSVSVMRRKKGSGYRTVGFSFDASHGSASGAVAVCILDELVQPNSRPRKVRDVAAFVAPFVTAIFVARAAGTDDPQYLAELQAARTRGWIPDPDDGVDLVVFIPEPPDVGGQEPVEDSDGDANSASSEPTEEVVAEEPGAPDDLPAAGWYDDPGGDESWRYWNGRHWTEAYAQRSEPETMVGEQQ